MSAPATTAWGAIKGSYGRIGIYVTVTNGAQFSTVDISVYFWSKYNVSDSNNTFKFDDNSTEATTDRGSVAINTTVSSGSGWSESNQVLLETFTGIQYARRQVPLHIDCAAKLSGVDRVDGTMTVSTSYTIPALTSYTITYNANGGIGAPATQTVWGTSATISSTTPTRAGYVFVGWNTDPSATRHTYSAGSTYTISSNIALYAVWSANGYTVSYDANGGTGAPASQSKVHGVNLSLTTTVPTRTNYTFLGWGVSSSSTTVSHYPGDTYTNNASITLYAIWTQSYTKPRITNLKVQRCDSSGNATDSGTSAKITYNWSTDEPFTKVEYAYKLSSSTSWTYFSYYADAGKTSGSATYTISGKFDVESVYDIRVTVTDEKGSTSIISTLPGKGYPIDFLAGGKGVAIGKTATNEYFDIGMDTYVHGVPVTGNSLAVKGVNTLVGTGTGRLSSVTNVINWGLQRFSFHRIDSAALSNQPSSSGFLLNLPYETSDASNVAQLYIPSEIPDNVGEYEYTGISWRSGVGSSNIDIATGWNNWLTTVNTDSSGNVKGRFNFTQYARFSNGINAIGKYRLHEGWIGFYGSVANAQNNASRLGWIGFDTGSNFNVINNVGGGCTTNAAWTVDSDKRLKQDIEDLPEVFISIWKELLPKVFRWNEKHSKNKDFHFGLIAQDVIAAFEKYGLDYRDYGLVNSLQLQDDDTEYFGIAYDEYHMLTSLVLRDSMNKIDSMQAQIDELKAAVNELKNNR